MCHSISNTGVCLSSSLALIQNFNSPCPFSFSLISVSISVLSLVIIIIMKIYNMPDLNWSEETSRRQQFFTQFLLLFIKNRHLIVVKTWPIMSSASLVPSCLYQWHDEQGQCVWQIVPNTSQASFSLHRYIGNQQGSTLRSANMKQKWLLLYKYWPKNQIRSLQMEIFACFLHFQSSWLHIAFLHQFSFKHKNLTVVRKHHDHTVIHKHHNRTMIHKHHNHTMIHKHQRQSYNDTQVTNTAIKPGHSDCYIFTRSHTCTLYLLTKICFYP